MHVYFVRHGETELNRRFIHQSPSTPLSLRGREQALTAAEYLRPMNPDILLTSDYTRAQETARLIGSVLSLSPQADARFREVERPTSLCGRSLFHPLTYWYVLNSVVRRNNPVWRYNDAENFNDIYTRVEKTLVYLESFYGTHDSIAIVSHTMFINLMVAYMCKNRILAIRDLLPAFLHVKQMGNGEVVGIKYTGPSDKQVCTWQLVHHAR
jgi:broad specificity phosphatase PhoE